MNFARQRYKIHIFDDTKRILDLRYWVAGRYKRTVMCWVCHATAIPTQMPTVVATIPLWSLPMQRSVITSPWKCGMSLYAETTTCLTVHNWWIWKLVRTLNTWCSRHSFSTNKQHPRTSPNSQTTKQSNGLERIS